MYVSLSNKKSYLSMIFYKEIQYIFENKLVNSKS